MNKVNRQWHDPVTLSPVSGEHVIIYLKTGTPGFGFGDQPNGLTYMVDAWYFADPRDLLEIHPLAEPPVSEGPFFWVTEGGVMLPDAVEYWHPMLQPPGIEIPQGSIRCSQCNDAMRHTPGHPGHFQCFTCGRVIRSSFNVVVEGGVARPK